MRHSTGETHAVTEMLDLAIDRLQLDWKKHVQLDQMYYRTTEVDFQELIAKMVDADLAAEKRKIG